MLLRVACWTSRTYDARPFAGIGRMLHCAGGASSPVRRFSYDDAVSSAPSPRLADRLADAEATALVGRTVERELLVGLLTAEPGPAIVFLHGPGGIGKTILLHGVLDRLGAASVRIDGRHVEPTPTGLLDAIAAVLGVAELRSVQDAAARLEAAGTRLLAIDSYEHLGIIDGWLRNDLLPVLPAAMRTVTAGRNPPNHAWRTAAGWRTLIAEQLLGPLSEADAALLLRRRALPEPVVAHALRFGRGHPLALELIAEALSRRPDLARPGRSAARGRRGARGRDLRRIASRCSTHRRACVGASSGDRAVARRRPGRRRWRWSATCCGVAHVARSALHLGDALRLGVQCRDPRGDRDGARAAQSRHWRASSDAGRRVLRSRRSVVPPDGDRRRTCCTLFRTRSSVPRSCHRKGSSTPWSPPRPTTVRRCWRSSSAIKVAPAPNWRLAGGPTTATGSW